MILRAGAWLMWMAGLLIALSIFFFSYDLRWLLYRSVDLSWEATRVVVLAATLLAGSLVLGALWVLALDVRRQFSQVDRQNSR